MAKFKVIINVGKTLLKIEDVEAATSNEAEDSVRASLSITAQKQ